MSNLEDLYREIILDHYRSPRNRGELATPPAHRVEGFNPLCGDEVVISLLVEDGKLARDLSLPAIDAEHDRFMLCGSPAMLKDLVGVLEAKGFDEANSDRRGSYVIERAFVEK